MRKPQVVTASVQILTVVFKELISLQINVERYIWSRLVLSAAQRETMRVRFRSPILEIIDEEIICSQDEVIKEVNNRYRKNEDENSKDESKTTDDTQNENNGVKTKKEERYADGTEVDGSKREENNKKENKKDENSGDEINENHIDEPKVDQSLHLRNKIENKERANDRNQKPSYTQTISQTEGIDNLGQDECSSVNSIVTEFSLEEEDISGASVWVKWRIAFSWSDFFYSLIFGLGPTAWDVLSDLRFGWSMARSGDLSSAGLCYLFTILPGFFFLQEVIMVHIFKDCSSKVNTTIVVATTLVATSALALGFLLNPLLFQYPATILGCSNVGVKVLAVFVHTPEMKALSVRVSSFEYTTESSLQLLLLLHLWLSGGPLYLFTILSSLLVIGKCGAEEYLMGNPENLLKDMNAMGKLWLIIKYIPLFSLTALFRVGAGVVKVGLS